MRAIQAISDNQTTSRCKAACELVQSAFNGVTQNCSAIPPIAGRVDLFVLLSHAITTKKVAISEKQDPLLNTFFTKLCNDRTTKWENLGLLSAEVRFLCDLNGAVVQDVLNLIIGVGTDAQRQSAQRVLEAIAVDQAEFARAQQATQQRGQPQPDSAETDLANLMAFTRQAYTKASEAVAAAQSTHEGKSALSSVTTVEEFKRTIDARAHSGDAVFYIGGKVKEIPSVATPEQCIANILMLKNLLDAIKQSVILEGDDVFKSDPYKSAVKTIKEKTLEILKQRTGGTLSDDAVVAAHDIVSTHYRGGLHLPSFFPGSGTTSLSKLGFTKHWDKYMAKQSAPRQ